MAGFTRRWARKAGRKWSELQDEYEEGKKPDEVESGAGPGAPEAGTAEFDISIPLSETEELEPGQDPDLA